jgi:hypothetical protein
MDFGILERGASRSSRGKKKNSHLGSPPNTVLTSTKDSETEFVSESDYGNAFIDEVFGMDSEPGLRGAEGGYANYNPSTEFDGSHGGYGNSLPYRMNNAFVSYSMPTYATSNDLSSAVGSYSKDNHGENIGY